MYTYINIHIYIYTHTHTHRLIYAFVTHDFSSALGLTICLNLRGSFLQQSGLNQKNISKKNP